MEEDHPERQRFLELLSTLNFANRYYAYCAAHAERGPALSTEVQFAVFKDVGRVFRHDKREKFFAWRSDRPPSGCTFGLNIHVAGSIVEWILVFQTPAGHLGAPFALLAQQEKSRTQPTYRHQPPYPKPSVTSQRELVEVVQVGLALSDELADRLSTMSWT